MTGSAEKWSPFLWVAIGMFLFMVAVCCLLPGVLVSLMG